MGRSIVSKEVLRNAVTVAKNATVYSNSRAFDDCDGTAIVKLISTAGSITVTQQCSLDNVNWYDPETASGAAGAVEATVTVTTGKYISFTPVLAPFIRFKIVEGNVAATVVTLELIYRVEVN
jgi:hypothetical protein